MGVMNLLKANWYGKVGQTVGAKWKNLSTIRSYTKPTYTDTPAQQQIRTYFAAITAFLTLFTAELKSLCALPTRGMSVRNAIMKLNKLQFTAGAFDPSNVLISSGGLPQPIGFTPTSPAGLASLVCTWTPNTNQILSSRARMVVVAATETGELGAVGSALLSAGTLTITTTVPASTALHFYAYLLDYRGSAKVASRSVYETVTSPAA